MRSMRSKGRGHSADTEGAPATIDARSSERYWRNTSQESSWTTEMTSSTSGKRATADAVSSADGASTQMPKCPASPNSQSKRGADGTSSGRPSRTVTQPEAMAARRCRIQFMLYAHHRQSSVVAASMARMENRSLGLSFMAFQVANRLGIPVAPSPSETAAGGERAAHRRPCRLPTICRSLVHRTAGPRLSQPHEHGEP